MNPQTKILVVDDFSPMRRSVISCLTELGFSNVTEAEDGEGALAKLKHEPFQLIISDWNMPNMMGSAFLEAVRSDKALQNIPFLMVTAVGLKDDALAEITNAAADYIVKPFDTAALRQKLERALVG